MGDWYDDLLEMLGSRTRGPTGPVELPNMPPAIDERIPTSKMGGAPPEPPQDLKGVKWGRQTVSEDPGKLFQDIGRKMGIDPEDFHDVAETARKVQEGRIPKAQGRRMLQTFPPGTARKFKAIARKMALKRGAKAVGKAVLKGAGWVAVPVTEVAFPEYAAAPTRIGNDLEAMRALGMPTQSLEASRIREDLPPEQKAWLLEQIYGKR